MPNRRMKLRDAETIHAMLEAKVPYSEISEKTGFTELTIKRMHTVLRKYGREQRAVSAIRAR